MIDNVNHPKHYVRNGLETIDVIEAFTSNLTGYEAVCTGNALKYLCRWKEKNGIEDLKKAEWYLKRLIAKLEYTDTDTVKKDVIDEVTWRSTKSDSLYLKFHEKLQELLNNGMTYSDAFMEARKHFVEEAGIDPVTGNRFELYDPKLNYGSSYDAERIKEILNDKFVKHS